MEYYRHSPICPNCGTKQTNLISTTDDPEMGDSYFVCENCKHEIKVHAHMAFEYIDMNLPSCSGFIKHTKDINISDAINILIADEYPDDNRDFTWNCPKCGHDNDNSRLFCEMCEDLGDD